MSDALEARTLCNTMACIRAGCCTRLGGDCAVPAHDEPAVSPVVDSGVSIGSVLQIEVAIGATDVLDEAAGVEVSTEPSCSVLSNISIGSISISTLVRIDLLSNPFDLDSNPQSCYLTKSRTASLNFSDSSQNGQWPLSANVTSSASGIWLCSHAPTSPG